VSEESRTRFPTEEPALQRRFGLYRYQWLGIPLILAIPVLALFGVFGVSTGSESAANTSWSMRVEYPSRIRYYQQEKLQIWLKNLSATPRDTVRVFVDSGYLDAFADVSFTPQAKESYEVDLTGVKPGEVRLIEAELRASDYGRHEGWVVAAAGGTDAVRARVSTFTFP
jgi:hypothetical protein